MPIYEQQNSVAGGLNLDDSFITPVAGQNDSLFLLGDYRYALNCRIGSSENGNEGSCQNIRGTKKITTILSWDGVSFVEGATMPAGNNKCCGFFENITDQNVIFLNYNSNGNHGIYRFELKEQKIYEILIDPILNFSSDVIITQIGIFGSLLFFAEISNPQRLIDIDQIHKTKYNIVAGGKEISDFHINLIKVPPPPPEITLETEPDVDDNLENGVYQACYRYVYKDNTRSVWSPRSNMATKAKQKDGTHNKLIIRSQGSIYGLTEAEIASNGGLNAFTNIDIRAQEFIDHIEIAVRESQYLPYKFVKANDFDTIGNVIGEFYNDVKGSPVASDEINQLQDYIPLRSGACTGIDNRILLGDNIEDFPHVEVLVKNPIIYQTKEKGVFDRTNWATIFRNDFQPPITFDRLSELNQGNTLSFKSGGIYQLALEFGEDGGRKSLAYTPEELRFKIPWENTLNVETVQSTWNAVGFELDPNFKPPEWATWMQVLRSECLNIELFIKGVVNGFEFRRDNPSGDLGFSVIEMDSLSAHPVYDSIRDLLFSEKTEIASEASFIYIDIRNWSNASVKTDTPRRPDERGLVNIAMGVTAKESLQENPSNKIYYNFKEGDKVRFRAINSNGSYEIYDEEIVKIDSYYLVVDKPENVNRFSSGFAETVEVYRPKKIPDENIPLYECGEYYPILNPKTANRDWSKKSWKRPGVSVDFDNNEIDVTKFGDTYIYDNYPVRNGDVHLIPHKMYFDAEFTEGVNFGDSTEDDYTREVMNPDIEKTSGEWQHCSGRPNIAYAKEAREREKEGQIKFSGKYIEDSIQVNINNFEEKNQKIYSTSYGKIRALVTTSSAQVESVGEILLAICENETVSIYVNRTTTEELSGNTQILLSDKVLGSYNTLLGSHGTRNPESVEVDHGRVYFWNGNIGSWIRYGRDGLTAISDYKVKNFHKDISDFLIDHYDTAEVPVVLSAFDKYNDELITAFKHSALPETFNNIPGPYKVCGFNDSTGHRRWKSFYDYEAPEMFGSINNTLLSFVNGELYMAEESIDSLFGTFYGNKYNSKIEMVTNMKGSNNKVFKHIYLISVDKWSVERFLTDEKSKLGQQQESALTLESFEESEGTFNSEILNDKYSFGFPSIGEAIINGDDMRGKYLRTLLVLDPSINHKTSLEYMGVGFTLSAKNPKN